MIKILISFVMVGLFWMANASASLVAYWNFDDQATAVTDSAGSYSGIRTGTQYVDGVMGKALSFYGGSGVNFGNVLMLTGTDFSISFWIKTTQTSNAFLFIKHTSGVVGDGYHFNLNYQGLNKVTSYNAGPYNVVSSVAVNDGNWHHIVFTHKVGGQEIVYVDGIQRGSATANAHTANSQNLMMGSSYVGLLDDFRVYNNVLTTTDIANIATVPEATTSVLLSIVGIVILMGKKLRLWS